MSLKNKRNLYLAASVLLHLLAGLVIWALTQLNLLAFAEPTSQLPDDPLVFELQQDQRRHEVVETPEDARVDEAPEDAQLASDKNARAQNAEAPADLDLGEAFAKGDFDVRELPTDPMPPGQPGGRAQQRQEEETRKLEEDLEAEEGDLFAQAEPQKFSREYLTTPPNQVQPGGRDSPPRVRRDQRRSRVPDMGGLSFNTYEWNFAPYMLRLKRRVERNIFPPPAFVRMGIISGETLLRFRIYPDGRLENVEVLEYQGHDSLMRTSVSAIEISAPYEPLPSDFPEEYLEVTARFSYFVQRNH